MSETAKIKSEIIFLFKVCTANKVSFVNAFYGAYAFACAATGAFIVINGCKVINNLDRSDRAGFFALAAGDASVRAGLSYRRAFVVAITGNDDARRIFDKVNDTVGAFLYAKSATDAFFRLNSGNAVLADANSVAGANSYAIAVSEAGEGAKVITLIVHICGFAVFRALVEIFFLFGNAGRAVAGNVCYLLNYV